MDLEKSGGVWKQRRSLDDVSISAGGEVVDPNLSPEEALIAKEEEAAAEAADKGMTLKQYRESQKGQKFDKAA